MAKVTRPRAARLIMMKPFKLASCTAAAFKPLVGVAVEPEADKVAPYKTRKESRT
jgi:hypothetical protein